MTPPAAISGNFADIKLVKTRSVVQMVIEIPIERAKEVTDAFGWPQPGSEIHVAVARLRVGQQEEKPKRSWKQMTRAEQAGVLCNDPAFQNWIAWHEVYGGLLESDSDSRWVTRSVTAEGAARYVRRACGVKSRSELDPPDGNATGYAPAEAWDRLVSEFRQATGKEAERR